MNESVTKKMFNINKNIIFQSKALIIVSILIINNIYIYTNSKLLFLKPFEKYINACKNSRKIKRTKIFSKNPYISVCMAALNMKLYIKQNLLSILNQSFQDFEIIIINDFSKDETEKIINDLQLSDTRIKLVNHLNNLGVYRSRIEAMLNSNGEYILLIHKYFTSLIYLLTNKVNGS